VREIPLVATMFGLLKLSSMIEPCLREAVREAARARVGALRADPETRLPAIESEAEFLALLARVSIATSLDELSSPSARS